jgi:hypothetical protein
MKHKVRNCEINLGYFKQGDDFGQFLRENNGDCLKALEAHAKMLLDSAQHLREVKILLEKAGVFTMEGDTHSIYLSVDDSEAIRKAIKNDLIFEMKDEE